MEQIADEVCTRVQRWVPRRMIMRVVRLERIDYQRGCRTGHDGPDARAEIMWRVRHELGSCDADIARLFEMDRTTVAHWMRKAYCPVAGAGPRIREREDQNRETARQKLERERESACMMIVQRLRDAEQDMLRIEAEAARNDPRSITGRFCGDPMPGRSALDRRRMQ
jgi:hypothetical protein